MDRTAQISIIVPVYNAEAYLGRCVEGILAQDYQDYELILVEDGSPDGSAAMCDAFARTDSRVRVIHKPNGGASSARNAGVEAAQGEFVLFIDSDDYIAPGSLGKIMRRVAENDVRDVTFLKAMSVFPNGGMAEKDRHDRTWYKNRSHEEVLTHFASMPQLPVCVWGKLIRRQVLADHHITFVEGIICEDVDYCIRLYLHAQTYDYIDEDFYYYIEDRPGSVMSVHTDRKYIDLLSIIARWAALSKGAYAAQGASIQSMLAFQYSMLMGLYQRLPKEKRREQLDAMRAHAWLLGCARDVRVRALWMACHLLGIGGACRVMHAYEELKKRGVRVG